MASLLPFIADQRTLNPLDCSATKCPASHSLSRRWGTDRAVYGGVGGAATHVIRQGGVVSRSHRHYGTGNINCLAQKQPYIVTDLLLSDCRPYDQLLPPPLLTDEIVQHRQLCRYPSNHTYTSHQSKFAVFPLAHPPPDTAHRHSSLTHRTTEALQEIHQCQFHTSTYSDTYRNHWNRRLPRDNSVRSTTSGNNGDGVASEDDGGEDGELQLCCLCQRKCESELEAAVTESTPSSTVVMETRDRCGLCKEKDGAVKKCKSGCGSDDSVEMGPMNGSESSGQVMVGDDGGGKCEGDGEKRESVISRHPKRVHWEDEEKEREERGEREEGGMEGVREERGGRKVESRGEREGEIEEQVCEAEGEEKVMMSRREEVVATTLPQLPHHFRRVSSKYYRNKHAQTWPCTIPYYLQRPHSILQTFIPNPKLPDVTTESVEEEPVAMTMVESKVKVEDDVMFNGEKEDTYLPPIPCDKVDRGDVTGESPLVPPPLSAMLHVSGSRVPHRLGVRFQTQAHTRYHQLYPEGIPDLRDAQVQNKKYFFYGFHSSIFRGS